jgi:alkylhydroperoxidase/carboxymuconolactone decarboxylase family protein YurZ
MRDCERTLRRLAVSDDKLVASVLEQSAPAIGCGNARMRPLFRLAALVASEGTSASYQSVVESALAAGASVEEIVEVLLAVAATVGSARVVAAAPILARVVGFDVDEAFDGDEAPSSAHPR